MKSFFTFSDDLPQVTDKLDDVNLHPALLASDGNWTCNRSVDKHLLYRCNPNLTTAAMTTYLICSCSIT